MNQLLGDKSDLEMIEHARLSKGKVAMEYSIYAVPLDRYNPSR
jgi:hypothetical protein